MKKLFAFITVLGLLSVSAATLVNAQDPTPATTQQAADTQQVAPAPEAAQAATQPAPEGKSVHQLIKQKFIEGGAEWMSPIIFCLIIGLAIAIERIIYLNLASINTEKLLKQVEDALNSGGIEAAKEVCRNTRGPIPSIFYQGLMRMGEGLEVVEKSVISYGGVQAGLLEKGMTWIGLFIALAPMLGFLGTVVGMVFAFDAIEAAGDISPSLVAGGIKVALITTIGGLIVAMILQVFYNYILTKIDGLVNQMEDASISLIDILTAYSKKN